MSDRNLRCLWDVLLQIYREFSRICDKHHLRYYACGGTALGAVRHKGFIPWDDDLDMFMPRPDYKKFITIVAHELPQGYYWRSIETDSSMDVPFGKLYCKNDAILAKARSSGYKLANGAAIDVLPLDGVPRGGLRLFLWLLVRSLLCRLPAIFTANKRARLLYQQFLSNIDYDTAVRVEDAKESAKRLRRTAWTPKTFGEPVWMDFDSVKMPLPHDWDEYLRGMIGEDYMQLPPLEKRVGHQQ